jgi:hypothetical protein
MKNDKTENNREVRQEREGIQGVETPWISLISPTLCGLCALRGL